MTSKSFNERHAQALKEMKLDEMWGFGSGKSLEAVKDFLRGDSALRYLDSFAKHEFGGDRVKAVEKLAPVLLQHARNNIDPVVLQDRLVTLIRAYLKDPKFGQEDDTSHVEPAMAAGSREPRDIATQHRLQPGSGRSSDSEIWSRGRLRQDLRGGKS